MNRVFKLDHLVQTRDISEPLMIIFRLFKASLMITPHLRLPQLLPSIRLDGPDVVQQLQHATDPSVLVSHHVDAGGLDPDRDPAVDGDEQQADS